MTVIQCDRCKKIIDKGEEVIFEHKPFDKISEVKEPLKIDNRARWDFCDECYKELKIFLGVKKE